MLLLGGAGDGPALVARLQNPQFGVLPPAVSVADRGWRLVVKEPGRKPAQSTASFPHTFPAPLWGLLSIVQGQGSVECFQNIYTAREDGIMHALEPGISFSGFQPCAVLG